jgi:hypothetical protein
VKTAAHSHDASAPLPSVVFLFTSSRSSTLLPSTLTMAQYPPLETRDLRELVHDSRTPAAPSNTPPVTHESDSQRADLSRRSDGATRGTRSRVHRPAPSCRTRLASDAPESAHSGRPRSAPRQPATAIVRAAPAARLPERGDRHLLRGRGP